MRDENSLSEWSDINTVFILDFCRSGGFWGGRDGGDLERIAEDLGGNVALIASAPETGDSFSLFGRSLFSSAVVRGLRTGAADLNWDGSITTSELGLYLTLTAHYHELYGVPLPVTDIDPTPGELRPFEWAPVFFQSPGYTDFVFSSPIPEPSSLALLSIGVGALMRARRTRFGR